MEFKYTEETVVVSSEGSKDKKPYFLKKIKFKIQLTLKGLKKDCIKPFIFNKE
jgi:hypothetical protein